MNEGKILADAKRADDEFDRVNMCLVRNTKVDPNQVTEFVDNLMSTIMIPNPELKEQMYNVLLAITNINEGPFLSSYINLIHVCIADITSRFPSNNREIALKIIRNLTRYNETIPRLSQTKFAQVLINVALSDNPLSKTAFSILINMATDGSCRYTLESADVINKLDEFLSMIDSDEANDEIVSMGLWLLNNMVDVVVNFDRFLDIIARYIGPDMRPCHKRALITLKAISHNCQCDPDLVRSILPLELAIELLRSNGPEVGYAALFAADEIYSPDELAAMPMAVYQNLWNELEPNGKEDLTTVISTIFDDAPSVIPNAIACGFMNDLIEESLNGSFNSASSAAAAVMTATASLPESLLPMTIEVQFIKAAIDLLDLERFSCLVVNYLTVLTEAAEGVFGDEIISQFEDAEVIMKLEEARDDSNIGELVDQLIDVITNLLEK